MSDFHGFPVRRISSKFLEMDCLAAAGPRIVRLRYKGSGNLLAEVPELALQTPYGEYRYVGGHRLWHSPESMPRSYVPDGEGVVASELPDGLLLEANVESQTGIRKRLEIHLDAERPRAILTHTLANEGSWEVKLAPWAITMLRIGGIAILPTRTDDVNTAGLLPDRNISLWPYSQIHDPRVQLEDAFVLIKPAPDTPPFKIGTFNPRGWIAYWLGDVVFRKVFPVRAGLRHPDNNCNAEIYTDSHFIELESLGPLTRLAPGASVTHTETWEFYGPREQDFLSESVMESVNRLRSAK